jgi:hypothetical protein
LPEQVWACGQQIIGSDVDKIRIAGFLGSIRERVGNGCNDLIATGEVLEQLRGFETRDLGLQQVPLDRVVGSSRPQDFDLQFNPKRRVENGRLSSIATAVDMGKYLPPPLLLKIQSSYFVVDGNHRISAARRLDQEDIQARVTEVESEDLVSEPRCSRLGFRSR